MPKIRYCNESQNSTRSCKARGDGLRVSFKNTRETAMALKNKTLTAAQAYLEDVLEHKAGVPMRRFNGGPSRKALAKHHPYATQIRFPTKSCNVLLGLVKNAIANAEFKQLDASQMRITHVAVQRAVKIRRRTFRAHGRINSYMRSPCHVELVAEQDDEQVPVSSSTAVSI